MIDVVQEINATRRQLGHQVLAPGEGHTVIISREYGAPVDEVWDACTDPERVPRWFVPLSGDLRPGGHYQLEGNAGGTIERCDPPTSFSVTWEYGGQVSWLELRLTPAGDDRTQLELAHTVPDDAKWAEYGPGAVGPGWDLALLGLGAHLTPDAPARELNPGWIGTGDGERFLRLSSARWCEASIAGGTDPATAQRAADRSAAFWCPPAPHEPGAGGVPRAEDEDA